MRGKPDVAAEVAVLSGLSRADLAARWQKIYGMAPPKGVRQELMVRAIAWHLQASRLGGLSAETRRLLRSAKARVESEMIAQGSRIDSPALQECKDGIVYNDVGADGAASAQGDTTETALAVPSIKPQRRRLAPGARLMREWNGRTHVVDVIEGGYVFEAKVYPSLSAIAGKITGAHWSGPRFFGL